MEDFFTLIEKRESCRDFSTRPVEQEKLVRCVEAARLAPSACNSQPWHFTVVTDPALKPRLVKCVQGMGMNRFADACPAFVVVTEETATLSARVAGLRKSQHFAQIDIGLATAQFCYAATAQGLSTCILGWLDEKEIKALLNLSEESRVRLVLCVGYAGEGALRPKRRKALEEIVTFFDGSPRTDDD